jgi:2'-5' RNA ligase
VLDRVGYFSRHRIAWAGMTVVPQALFGLQQTLTQALVKHGIVFTDRPGFRPHITLAREALAPSPHIELEPIRWQAKRCVLAQSIMRPGGVFYQVLATQDFNGHK